jgi:putative DNA primase/helicase
MNMKQAATGHWKSILSGIIGEEYFTGRHCKCPVCELTGDGGTDRFRFTNRAGSGSYICNQCSRSSSGITLIANYLHISESDAWQVVEKALPSSDYDAPKKSRDYSKLIASLVDSSIAVVPGSDVHNYLASRLSHVLKFKGQELIIPPSIRQAKYVDFSGPEKLTYNAMMCSVTNGKALKGVHLTLLKDGKKAPIASPRRVLAMYDGALNGAAIHLNTSPLDGLLPLVVGEGIETCLAASLYFGMPAWSALNSTLLTCIEIPDIVREIVVAGDNDEKFGGQAAAYGLAHKMAVKGRRVKVKIAPGTGLDFASPELLSNLPV